MHQHVPGRREWSRLDFTQGRMLPIQDHAAAYCPDSDDVVIMGGREGCDQYAPVNRWHRLQLADLRVYSRMALDRTYGNTMVYDGTSDRPRLLVHGGSSEGTRASDALWEIDLTQGLDKLAPKAAKVRGSKPEARYEHAAAFDPVRGWMVVYGGLDGHGLPINDKTTWLYDGASITWIPIEGAWIGERVSAVMDFDTKHSTVVLVGGRGKDERSLFGDAHYLDCQGPGAATETPGGPSAQPTADHTAGLPSPTATVTATATPTSAAARTSTATATPTAGASQSATLVATATTPPATAATPSSTLSTPTASAEPTSTWTPPTSRFECYMPFAVRG